MWQVEAGLVQPVSKFLTYIVVAVATKLIVRGDAAPVTKATGTELATLLVYRLKVNGPVPPTKVAVKL